MNAAKQSSTEFSPFKLVYGCEPLTPAVLASEGPVETKSADALDMVEEMQKDLGMAKENIRKAQQQQAKYYNKHRRDVQFHKGDLVYINSAHLKAYLPADTKMKLQKRWLGPFPVADVISPLAYKLTLPAHFEIHPVVSIEYLKAHNASKPAFGDRGEPSRPPPVNQAQEYAIEAIIGKRYIGRKLHYKIMWQGYPVWEATYEPAAYLKQRVPDLVREYDAKHPVLPKSRRGKKRPTRDG